MEYQQRLFINFAKAFDELSILEEILFLIISRGPSSQTIGLFISPPPPAYPSLISPINTSPPPSSSLLDGEVITDPPVSPSL